MLLFASGSCAPDPCLLKPCRVLRVPGSCTLAAVFHTVLSLSWAFMPAVASAVPDWLFPVLEQEKDPPSNNLCTFQTTVSMQFHSAGLQLPTSCICCVSIYLLQLQVPVAYVKAVQLWLFTIEWWHCSQAWPVSTAPLCSRPARAWSSSSSTSACWRARPTLKHGMPVFFCSSSQVTWLPGFVAAVVRSFCRVVPRSCCSSSPGPITAIFVRSFCSNS